MTSKTTRPFRRTRRSGGALLLLLPLLLLPVFGTVSGAADEALPFGPLHGKSLTGAKVSLEDLRGKVVVLNFWATWCPPCLQEMPNLTDLARRYGDRGLEVVAASVDEGAGRLDAGRVVGPTPPGMQVWVGASLDDMHRLGLGDGIPVTVVLDRDGHLVERHRGPIGKGALDKRVEELLGKGEAPKKVPGVTEASASTVEPPSL